jgi:predicted P-loop ATPase
MLVGGHAIEQWTGEVTDAAVYAARQLIIDTYGVDCGKDHVRDAVNWLCNKNRFDPVVDYIDGLEWDGVPRLGQWLTAYLGAPDTPLNRVIGELTLVAAVRRAHVPGCKFDHILVLEGKEGTMKSTAIVTLAGVENFSDQTILTASDKEQQELVRGVWIFEIADLAGMKRTEVEKVKAFASRTHDRARPAYGRQRIDAPRRCIFIGTTNDDQYLQSQTGNRRFWPVKTGTIDIEALRRDRDQLWAEAVAIEAKGEPLTLPRELWGDVGAAQEERRQYDPWEDILTTVKGELYPSADGEQEWIRAREVLVHLTITPDRATSDNYRRIKRVMERLGWNHGKHYFGGDKQERGYYRRAESLESRTPVRLIRLTVSNETDKADDSDRVRPMEMPVKRAQDG